MDESFRTLFIEDVAGVADRAGTTRLDLWIQSQKTTGKSDEQATRRFIIEVIDSEEKFNEDFWATIRSTVERLELRSLELALAIENAIARNETTSFCSDFEQFSAWQALQLTGGVVSPKHLRSRLSVLRSTSPTLWLDIASFVLEGEGSSLTSEVCALVADQLISFTDFKIRYREIKAALGDFSFLQMLNRIRAVAVLPEYKGPLEEWAEDKFGYILQKNNLQDSEVRVRSSTGLNGVPFDHISERLVEFSPPANYWSNMDFSVRSRAAST
jgi:hypothetical protein